MTRLTPPVKGRYMVPSPLGGRVRERGRALRAIAAVLAVLLILPFGAAGSRKISLKSKLGNVQNKIKDVKQKIEVKEGQKRTVIDQLGAVEEKLEAAQTSLASNKLQLLDAQADLALTVERLERTIKQLKRRMDLLGSRVADIYEGEYLSYANVVLDSEDMWTFLTRSEYLDEMIEADTELIGQIRDDKAQIEKDKARQTQRVAQISRLQVQLESERDEVAQLADVRRDQLEQIEHDKDLYEQALDELLAQSRAIESQIRRIQTGPGGGGYHGTFSGGLSRPVGGRLTSNFGYRVHPITGVYKLHTGVDLAASSGTPIKAAADGKVIIACYDKAYGNKVVIDHGSGISTLYGHCSRILCRVGQEVKRGDTIARVGSTGLSTGPHCHFEKRINGRPVNPL